MKTITITLKSPDEVMSELRDATPLEATPKGSWVWVYDAASAGYKEILKGIGFQWSAKRRAWYHTCETDPTKRVRRFSKQTPNGGKVSVSAVPPAPPPRTQTVSDIEAEFLKRFG